MKKTLITGATGSLGQLLVNALKSKTEVSNIAVLVRDTEKDIVKEYQTQGLDIRVSDYENLDKLTAAFEGIEQVFLISGNDLGARLQQHKNVVEAAKAANVKHIFYTSSVRKTESKDAPLDPVVSGHAQTEEAILNSGLDYTILRHNLYSEVVLMFIGDKEQLLKTKSVYLPTENGKVAFVPRKDFAEAEANILISPEDYTNKIYEFNGSQQVSFEEISEILTEILGEKIAYVSPKVDEFESQMKAAGLPDPIVGMLSMFSQGVANGEFNFEKTDIEKALGRKTQTLKEFLGEVYA
ncbi:SDR family oxidoreductase [Zunongwangia sp. SCSIO 43204]|uniref:SDR family oxidoreductase n=1 Tax=Zunongwangia sp. SCSIO 43204 TaxID=2779359 RepID=UPI001CA819EB|nr:SDR family oxidoreductase [Zunongwangia sp. SCSIO 43204]UAB85563.1 SDR family oxidoreductase [Zunongwangia sp. SCSIO 43204]